MKYMLLIYGNEQVWDEAGREACYVESTHLAHELAAAGKLLGVNPLHPVSSGTSVRGRDGKRFVTDGPFAETREQLGGYFLVDVKDLDEAIEIAKRVPGGRLGTVEIRPILDIGGLPETAAQQPAAAGAHA